VPSFSLEKPKNASKNTLEKGFFTDIPAGNGIKRVIKSNASQILMRFIGNPFSNRHEESFKEIKFTVAFFQEAAFHLPILELSMFESLYNLPQTIDNF